MPNEKTELDKQQEANDVAARIAKHDMIKKKHLEQAALIAAQQQKAADAVKVDEPASLRLSPVTYSAKGQSLVDAYKEFFGKDIIKYPFYKEPSPDPKSGACLFIFESETQAADFFNTQAKNGCQFLCQEEGKGFNGVNFYSCGDTICYQGSVEQIIKDLTDAIKAESDSTKKAIIEVGLAQFKRITNPAPAFRDVLAASGTFSAPPAPPPSPSTSPRSNK